MNILYHAVFFLLAPTTVAYGSLRSRKQASSRTELDNAGALEDSCRYFTLDFDGVLEAGDYITDQFLHDYGVVVWADAERGGYTPNAAARLLDTSNPINHGLGSPNENCPIPGPGKGVGGAPESNYSNCDELGMVLIIQEENKDIPDDNEGGGKIIFDFEYPSNIEEITLLNIADDATPEVEILNMSGLRNTFKTSRTGENGLFKLRLVEPGVIRLVVKFPSSGAVAGLSYSQCIPSPSSCQVEHLEFNSNKLKREEDATDHLVVVDHGVSVTASDDVSQDGNVLTIFDFDFPRKIQELAISDIDERSPVLVEFEYVFGSEVKVLYTETTVDDGLFVMNFNEFNVVSMTVRLPVTSGTVTHLVYKAMECDSQIDNGKYDDQNHDDFYQQEEAML